MPHRCPACVGKPQGMLFRFNGVLQTCHGTRVPESALFPCSVCGSGMLKTIDGVNPGRMLGIKVIGGVDPTAI